MSVASSRRFDYRAADASGSSVSGEIEAVSEREAVDALRRRGLWVTTIEHAGRVNEKRARPLPGGQHAARRGLSTLAREIFHRITGQSVDAELAVVVRAMSTLLSAGVPLDRALAFAAGPATRDDVGRALSEVRDRVRQGESLSHAVSQNPLFPRVFAPTLAAGEASGGLDATLSALADHLDRALNLRARLRASLAYPALLGVASTVGVVVILLVVVPRFAELVAESGGTLPLSTRALIWLSNATVRYGWLSMVVLLLGAWAARESFASQANRRRWHQFKLSLPFTGRLTSTRAAASYTGVLALALRSGVSLLPSMRLARGVVSNMHISHRLAEAESMVMAGDTLARALDGILPPLTVRLLEAGEVGGDLAAMAVRASESADAATQRTASTFVALMEPALILLFGGIVGFVALALLQAIYGINASSL